MAGLMTTMLGYGPEMTTRDPEKPATALPISNPVAAPAPAFNMTENPAADFQPTTATPVQPTVVQPPVAPMMMVPETSVQTRVVDPKAAAEAAKAAAAEQEAIKKQAEAQQREDEIRAMSLQKVAQEADAEKQKYADAMKEFADKKVIDPTDKWGTEKKVGAAIAMGLGAFAAAYSGGKNYAAEIIKDSIDRDISLQEQEIKRLGTNVDASKNALAGLYQRMGDINQAKDVISMVALAGYEKEIMKLAEAAKNTKTQANAEALIAAIKTKQAETASRMTETVVTKTQKAVAMTGTQDQSLVTPYGPAPSKDAANIVRQRATEIAEAKEGLSTFKEVIEKYGSWNMVPSKEKGIYQSALLPVINAYRTALNLGVLNPSEREKIEAELKNKISTEEATAFITGMEKMIEMNERAVKGAYIVGSGQQSAPAKLKQQMGFAK